jgi:hypothetical protein
VSLDDVDRLPHSRVGTAENKKFPLPSGEKNENRTPLLRQATPLTRNSALPCKGSNSCSVRAFFVTGGLQPPPDPVFVFRANAQHGSSKIPAKTTAPKRMAPRRITAAISINMTPLMAIRRAAGTNLPPVTPPSPDTPLRGRGRGVHLNLPFA